MANWSVTHSFRRKILLKTRPRAQSEANKDYQEDSDRSESDNENEGEEEQLVDEYMKKWDVLKLSNGYLLVSVL